MKYNVIFPIRHGGKRHEPPAIVEMDEHDAVPHLLAGVLTRYIGVDINVNVQGDVPPAPIPPATTAIVGLSADAIAGLYAYAELPTDSKPSVKETMALLHKEAPKSITVEGVVIDAKDYAVNAELRDQAWSLYLSGDYSAETGGAAE